jgi:hypothetical protein
MDFSEMYRNPRTVIRNYVYIKSCMGHDVLAIAWYVKVLCSALEKICVGNYFVIFELCDKYFTKNMKNDYIERTNMLELHKRKPLKSDVGGRKEKYMG